ncbi:MAG TPA: hypothetical protein VF145_06700 [Chitinophagaceae bacterium]
MKKCLFLSGFIVSFSLCFSQEITPPPAGKAVVYFARVSQLGFAINFSYFDSTQLIAKFNGSGYFRYECEPGQHVFWARSENRSFVEANLDSGKIYFIEAVPTMGGLKAAVDLTPINPATAEKRMAKILKLIGKQAAEDLPADDLAAEAKRMEDVVKRGWEKYQNDKANKENFPQLTADMNYVAR